MAFRKVMVVAEYAPVNGDDECEQFRNDMENVLYTCELSERVILVGDMNIWVGVRQETDNKAVGPFEDERTNENGRKLVSLCVERNMFVSNTWFKHKNIHMYPWQRGGLKSMIDFVI